MKKILATTISILLFNLTVAQTPTFQWAAQFGTTGNDYAWSVAVDASGNVYTTGYFNGTADFDPGVGTYSMTSAGSWDVFISKLDAAGNFVWAKRLGGTGGDFARDIAVDASGNVYTTGNFWGTGDYDPGPGTFTLAAGAGDDVWVSKLDASGNFVWAKNFNGVGGPMDWGNSLAVDASGNVYTTGYFQGTTDFDPSAATYSLTSGGTGASRDVFISKLNSAGNFVWAKQLGGTDKDEGNGIAVDASGNVYTTGTFSNTADFDPGVATFNLNSTGGSLDGFISKLDASGNFVWVKQLGGSSDDGGSSIAVDASGVCCTGNFNGTAVFGSYILTAASVGSTDIFVSKLDAAGNFLWVKQLGGTGGDVANSLALDASGSVYTTGYSGGTIDFDPSPSTYTITAPGGGSWDVFVWKLNSAGNFVWAGFFGGTSSDIGYGIAADAAGNAHTAGAFGVGADFDPGVGTFSLTVVGGFDGFIQKFGPGPTSVDQISISSNEINVYPNPGKGSFSISTSEEIANIKIFDLIGNEVKVDKNKNIYFIDNAKAGIYMIKISSEKESVVKKLVVE